ncbi:MAG: hypothetical protein ABIE36_00505 [Candidatus Diapherotrites archaeon]
MDQDNLHYPRKIKIESDKAYDEVSFFLGESSVSFEGIDDGRIYIFDELEEQVARANSKNRTIELTDKVEDWIYKSIKHIMHTERVREGEGEFKNV